MIKTQVIGNIGKDAKATEVNGKFAINFPVAHNEQYPDTKTGEMIQKTIWVNCSLFLKKTEIVKYLTKGKKIYVEGVPSFSVYDSKGTPAVDVSLFVKHLEFLDAPTKEEETK